MQCLKLVSNPSRSRNIWSYCMRHYQQTTHKSQGGLVLSHHQFLHQRSIYTFDCLFKSQTDDPDKSKVAQSETSHDPKISPIITKDESGQEKVVDAAQVAVDSVKKISATQSVDGKVVAKIKTSIAYDNSMKSVKYITPLRAMRKYLLSTSDMEKLPKYYSRSPYSYETKTLVYRRSDVEALSYEKHGGQEKFEIKKKLTEEQDRKQRISIFNLKRALKHFQKPLDKDNNTFFERVTKLRSTSAGRVVLSAIAVNGFNCILKGGAWYISGSKSMFSEFMHSLADTLNQLILAYGLQSSFQRPDDKHPYGYISMPNIFSLFSGMGIFFLGSALSIYQGWQGLFHPYEMGSLYYALIVMSGSFLSESVTLYMAIRHVKKSSREKGMSFKEYVLSGVDPTTNVVLLEDVAAISGVVVAGSCMLLSSLMNSAIPDALGAIFVGSLLLPVSYFVVKKNIETLIGQSIPPTMKEDIMKIMDHSKIIRGTYDIKATSIGGDNVRFKAEVDIDGRQLTSRYLETVPLDELLKEIQNVNSQEQAVHFMLRHGDAIVNILGAEINKIEEKIKSDFPTVKHIDIEIN